MDKAVAETTWKLLFLGAPLLPTAVAQGLCIKYDWLGTLKEPLDLGLCFRGKRLFGDNKTWRGLTLNVVFCALGTLAQAWLLRENYFPARLALLDYEACGLLAGVLLGLGVTLGELPNSFLKRQLEIAPGEKKKGPWGVVFFLLDQVDLTLGAWLFLFWLVRPSLGLILWSLALTLVLHVAVSVTGYGLGMRKTLF
ncbi:MAG: CDP-archaeol synthase [Thermodesulfobacteriota bacterium]|nr:CDP-archaeol synthase [Thermodesulfobacteriota bacterium]